MPTPGEGIRVEELTELSHHSLVQYRLPDTDELIPLLHIAPSKTDAERLLVVEPELAVVLSAIICRIRDPHGVVPLAVSYDIHERVWNPPMPLLFQRKVGVENRPIPAGGVRALLNHALARTGLTDAGGAPLLFSPHDFRRLFITDAILNGMPPHIAQLVVGHPRHQHHHGIQEPSGIASDGIIAAGRLASGPRQWSPYIGPTRRLTCVPCVTRPLDARSSL